jgi:AcrR family transcriptional regulator
MLTKETQFMGVQERRERERLETREKILEAARELFITEGYDGVSMRKVAEKIEYSPTALYVHFADKEQLFLELCHSDFRRLAESFTKLAHTPDPIERIRQIGQAYISFGLQNPNHYRMMFMTAHPCVPDPGLLGKGNPEEDAYAFLRQTVSEAIAAGALRPELQDPDLVAQTLWAGVHGVVSLQIAKGEDDWVPWCGFQDRATLMIGRLLDGLLKPEK